MRHQHPLVANSSPADERPEQHGADGGRISACQERVSQQHRQCQRHPKPPMFHRHHQQRQQGNQHAHMEARNGQNMRNAEPPELFLFLVRHFVAHSQQHRTRQLSSFLAANVSQCLCHAVIEPCRQPIKRKPVRQRLQFRRTIQAYQDVLLPQSLPEVITMRIPLSLRMIDFGGHADSCPRRQEVRDIFIRLKVERPVRARCNALAVQRHVPQDNAYLPLLRAEVHLARDDARHLRVSFRRKRRIRRTDAQRRAKQERQQQAARRARSPPPQQKQSRQRRRHAEHRHCTRRCLEAEGDACHHQQCRAGQESGLQQCVPCSRVRHDTLRRYAPAPRPCESPAPV